MLDASFQAAHCDCVTTASKTTFLFWGKLSPRQQNERLPVRSYRRCGLLNGKSSIITALSRGANEPPSLFFLHLLMLFNVSLIDIEWQWGGNKDAAINFMRPIGWLISRQQIHQSANWRRRKNSEKCFMRSDNEARLCRCSIKRW